jgi:predicted nucleic acid-binding Zn ribbon protein
VRRRAPRPLQAALEALSGDVAPAGLLPAVQSAWAEVAGAPVAAEAQPTAERDGVVTVTCRSGVWAQELELMQGDLRARLTAQSGCAGLRGLRFVVGRAGAP